MKTIKTILKHLGLYSFVTQFYDTVNYEIQFLKLKISINKISNDTRVFFFFPFYHTGGAELVHLNIIKSISNQQNVTFFTLPSGDEDLKKEFFKISNCFDIQRFIRTENKKKTIAKSIANKINYNQKSVVFACHSSFFYYVLPFISDKKKKIDLIHAFTGENEPGHEKESLSYLDQINHRVVITNQVKSQLIELYDKNNIDKKNNNKIQVIYNATKLTFSNWKEKEIDEFTILYVGRNSPEKRIHLIGKIATKLKSFNEKIRLVLIGSNLENAVLPEDKKNCIFVGGMPQDEIGKWYEKAHATIITSWREGFPMVFMESMTFGCVPISTNVGGISELIRNQINGVLINNIDQEDELVNSFTNRIVELTEKRALFLEISKYCFDFAINNFNMSRFNQEYKTLLLHE